MSDRSSDQPTVEVTPELIDAVVTLAGYTHPLFADRTTGGTGDRPLPGQGVLLLMGGLVEQSGLLDDAVALLEMREVRFHRMVTAGSRLRVEIERGAQRTTPGGRLLVDYTWTAVDGDEPVATADVVMLMNDPEQRKVQEDQ